MQTWGNRGTTIVSYAVTVTAVLAALNMLSGFMFTVSPIAEISNPRVLGWRVHPYLRADQVNITFDFHADMSSLFHWNTKYVYLYVTAEYSSLKWNHSVVLWDRILTKDNATVDLTLSPKYEFTDLTTSAMRGKTVELVPSWMAMPVCGLLRTQSGHGTSFVLRQ
ncbi:signal peptidase complex subunit 3 [Pelomyxa schiedti]|nr:signal peptidase complex subunit 3 [Pelomyxa schiedti]